ncbi:protein-L-isoaspartate O-methyltransferase family protein [Pararhizobium haloflavum]|uniref:protein-L-isoaspartate O-methyltransferase family protein n=1 Tax=Pararhizobium haloflavum TaxID=2037914 RepID=UPI000C19BBFA|nr:protein-L-isoaspartate O-methyltransferase [Pararhizobium haloflavum]
MTTDFKTARARMVDNQIRTMDVTSHPVLDAFGDVPREAFVPEHLRDLAYIDEDIQIAPAGESAPARYVMEPAPLAKLVQLADIRASDVVLEIGCGTGYGSAILSQLASSVVALESDAALAAKAGETLSELGCDNVVVVQGPLAEGYADEAPYDAIVFSGAVEYVPQVILDQLREGGRLVVVEGAGNASRAKLYLRDGETTSPRAIFNTAVRMLPGFELSKEFVF